MGWRYREHDSMCGCDRCALRCERDDPAPVFDRIADPNYRDDGTRLSEPALDDDFYEEYDDE